MSEPRSGATSADARALADRRALLAHDPLLASLGVAVLDDIAGACELVDVAGGTCLVHAGETFDALLGVVHGGLRLVRRSDDGAERTVREYYRGDLFNVIGLLADRPTPVDLFAVRDSTVLRLSHARFLALADTHPALLLALARRLGERAFDFLEASVAPRRPPSSARGGNLALLRLSDGPLVRELQPLLVRALAAERRLTHLRADLVDDALGRGAAEGASGDAAGVPGWLSNLERTADVVLYECDTRLPGWSARCLRQSDRLLVIAAAGDVTRRERLARLIAPEAGGLSRPVDLVLVHAPTTDVPTGTRAWADLPGLRAIHHVRRGHRGDVARVARRLVGRPTGLVLSGGGARGIAHVGVIAALLEAGVPIDYVCGTSMGAIFAAGLALGFDMARMRAEVRELFARPFALYDLTLPISSLLAGKKLDRVLHRRLGDADIEDLWLPFFCVSTDLARARMVVHERGSLWRAVRASCSIPGIFPPLPENGGMLVDGGLVDNLPLDLLGERCSGPLIAVDVFPYGDPGFERPSNPVARVLRELRSRVRGEPASPPLFDVLVRSTLVGSKVRQQTAMLRAEQILYLEPPVASFGALQWRAHRALYEVGHRYAAAQLAQHRSLFPSA